MTAVKLNKTHISFYKLYNLQNPYRFKQQVNSGYL